MEMARIQAVATSHSGGDVDKWPRLFSVSKSGGGGRVFIKQKLNHTGQEDGLHEKRYILYLTFTTCLWIN